MKKRALYDHHREHIGVVEFHKKNHTAIAKYNHNNRIADVKMDVSEWEEYRKKFGFQYEEELGQIRMEDLL